MVVKRNKSKIYAVLGTLLFAILLVLLLLSLVMPLPESPEREDMGLIVSLGDNLENYGWEDKVKEVNSQSVSTIKEEVEENNIIEKEEDIITQKESLTAIPIKKKKSPIRKNEKKQLSVQDSTNRKTQEETDNFMKNIFQNNGNGGKVKKVEKNGNPVGKGNSNGHAWSLLGRGLIGSIVSPDYTNNVEGKITVAIRVDELGNVTTTSISSPTTISDKATRDAAIRAAQKTHFSSGKGISIGTITYNFKLQ